MNSNYSLRIWYDRARFCIQLLDLGGNHAGAQCDLAAIRERYIADVTLAKALEKAAQAITAREQSKRITMNDKSPSDCASVWNKIVTGYLEAELKRWLDEQSITSDNIGAIRARLTMPWTSRWNAIVRDETAKREQGKPVPRFWRLVEESETLLAGDEYLQDGLTWHLWPADFCGKHTNPVGRITRRMVLIPQGIDILSV